MSQMENLTTFLLANTVIEDKALEFDINKLLNREAFMQILKEATTKKDELPKTANYIPPVEIL